MNQNRDPTRTKRNTFFQGGVLQFRQLHARISLTDRTQELLHALGSEKTILPSLRNIEWKTLKIEKNKINHILPYIPMNNITELIELIYAGAKLVCEKIGIPSKSTKKQSKPGWEIRLETQIKKIRKQTRMIKKREALKKAGTKRNMQH